MWEMVWCVVRGGVEGGGGVVRVTTKVKVMPKVVPKVNVIPKVTGKVKITAKFNPRSKSC